MAFANYLLQKTLMAYMGGAVTRAHSLGPLYLSLIMEFFAMDAPDLSPADSCSRLPNTKLLRWYQFDQDDRKPDTVNLSLSNSCIDAKNYTQCRRGVLDAKQGNIYSADAGKILRSTLRISLFVCSAKQYATVPVTKVDATTTRSPAGMPAGYT